MQRPNLERRIERLERIVNELSQHVAPRSGARRLENDDRGLQRRSPGQGDSRRSVAIEGRRPSESRSMIVLDTDHISLIQHPDSEDCRRLLRRLDDSPDQDIVTTVVTVEEQMRGWLQVIARYRDPQQQAAYYYKLIDFVRFFGMWNIMPLNESAVRIFRELQKSGVRIATTDLKIAAICLSSDATLLSRNIQDFQRVPGLSVEDWTAS